MFEIKWVGSPYFEKGRCGVKPICIVDHVSQGTLTSMDNWFNDPSRANNPKDGGTSSTFGVGLDGTIHQYVRIEDTAWTQGISEDMIADAKAPIVHDMNCNPNIYCVSIEREGYYVQNEDGTTFGDPGWLDGSNIPDKQFYAICWLHRYIMDYSNNKMGAGMGLGEYNYIGHCHINPTGKPYCPGVKYPWTRFRAEAAIAERMTLAQYELRLTDILSGTDLKSRAYDVVLRVNSLWEKVVKKDKYEAEALDHLITIEADMKAKDILLP